MAAVYKVCGANVGGGRMALYRWGHGARPASALTALLRALLPSSCALCAQACAGVVCPACQRDSVIARPRCPRCANPLPALEAAAGRCCGACLASRPAYDSTIAAADYAAPLDQLLLQLKFAARLQLAPWFAQLLRDAILQQSSRGACLPDVIAPVPLGRRRLAERGFNQALEVAKPLARMLDVPLSPQLAARVIETAPQSTVAPAMRAANVHAAFAVTPGSLDGLHVALVDDVMTSGRTLDALARACKAAGAAKVSNYVVARTPPAGKHCCNMAACQLLSGVSLVSRRAGRTGNSPQYGQHHPPVRQHGRAAAPDRAARLSPRRQQDEAGRPRLPRLRDHAGAQELAGLSRCRQARSGAHVCPHHPRLLAVCRCRVPAGRRVRVRVGNAGAGAGLAQLLPAGPAHPPADASRQPQPEPVEHGGRGRLRSLAPERLPGRRLSAMAGKGADWEWYRSFLAVMQAGSVSAAARAMGLAQPTVGRHIDSLEQALQLKLFTRASDGLTPTDAGRALAPYAGEMASTAAALLRAASGQGDGVKGSVRISASDVVGVEVLPSILTPLRERYPELVIELMLSNQADDVLHRQADIAVRMFQPVQEALIAKRIGTIELGLFAHPRYLAQHGVPQSIDELAGHTLIGYDRETAFLRAQQAKYPYFKRERFDLRADSDVAQLAFIRAGYGLGVCQTGLAKRDGGLQRVLAGQLALKLDTWVVMHEGLRNSPRCAVTFAALAEGLAAYAGA